MTEEGKFLGVSATFWEGIQGVLAIAGAILALSGIFWGVMEYRGKLEADRTRQTLDLLDVWEERGYLESYRSLDRSVQSVLATVPEADIQAAAKDETMLAALYSKASAEILSDNSSRERFEEVVYFFERMHICVEANLCAEEATMLFFEDTVNSFAEVFRQPLEGFRTGPPEFFAALNSP